MIEYKAVPVYEAGDFNSKRSIESFLNSMGVNGWELVTVSSGHLVFKRDSDIDVEYFVVDSN